MNVLKPLDESDSAFMIFTKKLTTTKFHELLNKVQEFVSTLKEEDLVDNTLKELVVKQDPVGSCKQSVLLSYYQSQPTLEIDSPLQKATAVGSQSHIQSLHEELENLSKKVKLGEEHFTRKSLQNNLPQSYDINANFPLNKPVPPFAPEFEAYENAKEDFESPSNSTYQSSLSPQSISHNPFNQVSTAEFAVLENSPTDKYVQDTPKFPNENGLSAYVNKLWEEKGNLQDFDREYTKSHYHRTHPSFDSTFINLEAPDFDLNSIKPGMVSSKLAGALGMSSERDAPPYLANLSKIELPSYYRGETFYGINTPVPQNYNLESWEKAGVKPHLLGGGPRGYKEVQIVDEEIGKNKSKEDEQYLDKMLRKSQNYYIQNNIYYKVTGVGVDHQPIEID